MDTLSRQIVPVLYALSILLLVTSVYAILASQLYGDRSPENFGRFSYALFSVRPAAQTTTTTTTTPTPTPTTQFQLIRHSSAMLSSRFAQTGKGAPRRA